MPAVADQFAPGATNAWVSARRWTLVIGAWEPGRSGSQT